MTSASPADPTARRIAGHLLDIGAVLLRPEEPFTWASGLRSPVYCDNRLTLAHPPVRRAIRDAFADVLAHPSWRPEVVAGTATAGIPHAAWLAEVLDLPMAYVRARPKQHGRTNQIEGRVGEGERVVLVEDLVSTGGSSVSATEALRAAGAEVLGVVAIFSYGLPAAAAAFREVGTPLRTLTTFDALAALAAERGVLPAEQLDTLRAWRADPRRWSLAHGEAPGA